MKKVFLISGLLVFMASLPVYADSLLRVQCEDEDAGAEIFLNGKFVGECPMDASVKEGTVQMRARKMVDADHEKVFEKKLRVVEGVSQRVELVMSASQLTAEARQRKAAAEVAAVLRAADAGDIDAMQKMAERYDAGIGVKKDPAQAAIWRDLAESATAQAELRAANAGDIEAMKNIERRYDTGLGVVKDHSQAQVWREKITVAEHEKTVQENASKAQEMARIKQAQNKAKIDRFSFTPQIDEVSRKQGRENNPIVYLTSGPISLAVATIGDLLSLPTNTTELNKLKNEASLRPSTWGKPDSMIAKASLQHKASNPTAKKPLLVTAAK